MIYEMNHVYEWMNDEWKSVNLAAVYKVKPWQYNITLYVFIYLVAKPGVRIFLATGLRIFFLGDIKDFIYFRSLFFSYMWHESYIIHISLNSTSVTCYLNELMKTLAQHVISCYVINVMYSLCLITLNLPRVSQISL